MASETTASRRKAQDTADSAGDAGLEPVPDRPEHALPDAATCTAVLEKMLLIRRFEERAGEMYAKAKIGGFLHLAIGEEATIVGATQALREGDYLMSTYREHGHALARGTPARAVMAELFGRVDGCSGGRGGSMHLFDMDRRFLGGYGIVGGNLPLAIGVALASDYSAADDVTLCMSGDGATNQGTFGEAMNLAALWRLPVVFLVVNNQFGMGTAVERHSAVTDLSRKSGGYGVPGSRCDGMDVLDVHAATSEALAKARDDREPQLLEAVTYRFRGHSMADPEDYRDKEEVEEWRRRDPISVFGRRLADEGLLGTEQQEQLDSKATETVDEAVRFADESPLPDLDSLYDDLYVYGDQLQDRPTAWWTVDERSPETHRGEAERESGELAHELAEAGAAYAGAGDAQARRRRRRQEERESGEGERATSDREQEGGGD